MSFNQFRTNPGQSVSKFKGRTETPRAWPGTAVSTWTNGGLMGGAGYEYTDSYKHFAGGDYSGTMYIYGIPQTHRHLHIDFTMSQQSTWWNAPAYITVNGNVSQTQPSDGQWDGMKGQYWGKGWSTGNYQSNTGAREAFIRPPLGHSNMSNFMSLDIYNYSAGEDAAEPKCAKMWGQYGTGNSTSYALWMEGFGFFQKAASVQGGSPSPAITTLHSYNSYQNGHIGYQSYNLYGFGGEV